MNRAETAFWYLAVHVVSNFVPILGALLIGAGLSLLFKAVHG